MKKKIDSEENFKSELLKKEDELLELNNKVNDLQEKGMDYSS